MNRKMGLYSLVGFVVLLAVTLPGPSLRAQLADSAWPMFMRNTKHCSQSIYIGPETNLLKWKFELPTGVAGASPVIGPDGSIYLSNSSSLYAINADGSLKWRYKTSGGIGDCAPALSSDGTIYISSASNSFYALNSDGTLKWQYRSDTTYFSYSSPSIGTDGTVYVGSGLDLLAFKFDGDLLWKYRVGENVDSSPAISSDGTIYVRGDNNYLCAINKDGTLKWRLILGANEAGASTPAIGEDGTIYTQGGKFGGNLETGLYAINPDGSIKWVYADTDVLKRGKSPSVAFDGTIYIACNRKFVAIDTEGHRKWVFEPLSDGSIAAIDYNGTIFIGGYDNSLYAINSDGTFKWKYETLSNIHSSPAIGPDGTVYFGSADGFLYAVGPGRQPVAHTSPTPDIKANGQDGQITVSSGTPVSITASLAPGDQNGQLADWWIAANTPWAFYTFTFYGWYPGINLLFQYPLFGLTPVEIYNGSLPKGDYEFYFGVDMSPNGTLDSPLYYDFVQVHVSD